MNNATYVFDLDGTLVDTREAVRQAYLSVGVVMPDSAWGLPWTKWLADQPSGVMRHTEKQEVYPTMLKRWATPLPLLEHALRMMAPVITGASGPATLAVRDTFGPLHITLWGATPKDKVRWLKDRLGPVVYVDDSLATRELVMEKTPWKALSPEDALREILISQPSSSPREPMSV